MECVRLATFAMRTRFELVLVGNDENHLRAAGEEALREIVELERLLSRFKHDSDIGRINRLAAHQPVRVDARTFQLLQRVKQLSRETNGAFDITVGTWWEQHSAAKAIVGVDNFLLDEEAMTVKFTKEGLRLDLGGIGKGYALERAAKLLRDAGIENAFLHGGTSSVFAFGCDQNGNSWQVAIAHPINGETLTTVTLDNLGLSVSASHSAPRTPHLAPTINPLTGEPVTHTLLAAVLLPSPTDAEAWSTALLVLGEEGLTIFQKRHPNGWAILMDCDGNLRQFGQVGQSFTPCRFLSAH
ncbi:MAG: FAD:protein FMN transferase [Armatimonadetes bacterium]|nr:FAD:protein FMN transferase [Armatimonadota bacterium]MCX7969666.1 FAD:protein FMN transferase [Armatimonadota bacterium]MDW8144473.1 FAD:protein FMN transferase [Armatimonadota bacterium]